MQKIRPCAKVMPNLFWHKIILAHIRYFKNMFLSLIVVYNIS